MHIWTTQFLNTQVLHTSLWFHYQYWHNTLHNTFTTWLVGKCILYSVDMICTNKWKQWHPKQLISAPNWGHFVRLLLWKEELVFMAITFYALLCTLMFVVFGKACHNIMIIWISEIRQKSHLNTKKGIQITW